MERRIPKQEFEKFVRDGWEAIPRKLRYRVKNVALIVEDEPSEAVRRDERLADDETLFGRYVGIPATARGGVYGVGVTLPDTVTIYRNPIDEAAAGDPARARAIVIETVWHEFAHYFGLDEHEVRAREQGKRDSPQ